MTVFVNQKNNQFKLGIDWFKNIAKVKGHIKIEETRF